jgi:hypothetical protein
MKASWSSGMILVLGARGRWFNSVRGPIFLKLIIENQLLPFFFCEKEKNECEFKN